MLHNKLHIRSEKVLNVPAHLHYGRHMLEQFSKYKDHIALINSTTGESCTYSELSQQIVDIALSLARIGVGKGQVVSICSEDGLQYIPTMFGIICAGATFTATDVSGKATMLHRLNMVKPTVMFCSSHTYLTHKETLDSVGSIQHYILYGDEKLPGATLFRHFLTEHAPVEEFLPVPVEGCSDHAWILYSSGTTGLPKGVPMTHFNLIAHMMTKIDESYYAGKPVLTATEYYTYGLSCLHAGATVVFLLRDNVDDILRSIQKYKIKIMQEMPSTILELVKSPILDQYDVTSLERIVSASAPLSADVVIAVKNKFCNVRDVCQIYGATEIGVMCSDEKAPKGVKPGSVGIVSDNFVIKVVDPNTGKPLGPNERGEICVKSPSLCPGYLGFPASSHLDEEQFYKTGDIGYYDEDRYFFIVDRIKDMIKYHGFAVAPAELEAVLVAHPAVREAGVVGAPHETYQEVPLGFVVLQPGAKISEEELAAYVTSQVAHWMPLAGGVRFLPKLPRGVRGKIDRKQLRSMV